MGNREAADRHGPEFDQERNGPVHASPQQSGGARTESPEEMELRILVAERIGGGAWLDEAEWAE